MITERPLTFQTGTNGFIKGLNEGPRNGEEGTASAFSHVTRLADNYQMSCD